jgi:Tfp pilus assembly protein PilP
MSNYLNRITASDKDKAASSAKISEAHAKATVEQKISQLKAHSATLDDAYEAALSADPFDIDNVVDLTAEKAQNADNLKLVQTIYNTEFTDAN